MLSVPRVRFGIGDDFVWPHDVAVRRNCRQRICYTRHGQLIKYSDHETAASLESYCIVRFGTAGRQKRFGISMPF